MKNICFTDCETNGLLDTVTKFHCGVIIDANDCVFQFGPNEGPEYAAKLNEYSDIVFHNGIRYDVPVLEKLIGWSPKAGVDIIDTMVLARVAFADIKDKDFDSKKTYSIPGRLYGSHSLEAWGYRLGEMKGEYKDEFKKQCEAQGIDYTPGLEWDKFCPEMLAYNVQDVVVTKKLYEFVMENGNLTRQTITLEHEVAEIMAEQERNGFPFHMEAATKLYAELSRRRNELEVLTAKLFDPWVVKGPEVVSKVNSNKLGYTKDVPYTKVEIVTFNPGSRQHIANRLQRVHGWKPDSFTPTGQPIVDEGVLSKLPYECCKLLTEYMMVSKRLGQLSEGKEAWFRHYKKETGRIHGSVNPNGAVTGRATHSYPNVAQVPASKSPYGKECRQLWTPRKGWLLAGTDAAGLELRCLAHYMAKWDGGKYGQELIGGDIHTMNQKAAGLPTRDNAKTFIYAFLYGAGDEKIGSIIGKGRTAGKRIKERFFAMVPALNALVTAVQKASKRGYLIGIDGRRLNVRSEHAALNTLLQSAGAIICKQWLINVYTILNERGYHSGVDFEFHAWVHDELQIGVSPEVAPQMEDISREAMKRAEATFNFKCPLDIDCKVGANWYETH